MYCNRSGKRKRRETSPTFSHCPTAGDNKTPASPNFYTFSHYSPSSFRAIRHLFYAADWTPIDQELRSRYGRDEQCLFGPHKLKSIEELDAIVDSHYDFTEYDGEELGHMKIEARNEEMFKDRGYNLVHVGVGREGKKI